MQRTTTVAVLLVLLGAVLAACSGSGGGAGGASGLPQYARGIGTIEYVDQEGGFFALRAQDGTLYDPTNLPDGFQVDGIRVYYTVRIVPGAASIHMIGPVVEIIDISRLI
jgi:hypothetical protein